MGVTNWHTLLFMSFSQSSSSRGRTRLTALWQSATDWKAKRCLFSFFSVLCSHQLPSGLCVKKKKKGWSHMFLKASKPHNTSSSCALPSCGIILHCSFSTSTVTLAFWGENECEYDLELCFDMTVGVRFFISAGLLLAGEQGSLRAGFVPTCLLWCRAQ